MFTTGRAVGTPSRHHSGRSRRAEADIANEISRLIAILIVIEFNGQALPMDSENPLLPGWLPDWLLLAAASIIMVLLVAGGVLVLFLILRKVARNLKN
jgi:hypothetical protein